MSLEKEVELLRRYPIFRKIELSMLKLLCFSSELLSYETGQVIFNAGDPGDAAYVLIEGHAEVTVPTPSGPLRLNMLGPHDILGEIAVFADVPRTATVTALSRLVALRIGKAQLLSVVRQNPDAALELIGILAARLARTTAQLRAIQASAPTG